MWFVIPVFVFLQESSEAAIEENAIPFFYRGTVTVNKFLVPKETVVLRQWESEKFGFIKRFDKGRITTDKDLESWYFKC